jgi:hypothetical protein
MLPVFNLDMLNGIVSPTKFIMKLRPNATFGNIRSICQVCGHTDSPVTAIAVPLALVTCCRIALLLHYFSSLVTPAGTW